MTMRPGPRHGWAALTGAALLTLAVSPALAAAPTSKPNKTRTTRLAAPAPAVAVTPAPSATPVSTGAPAPPAAAAAGGLGLMAFLDPETGQLTGPIGQLVPPADQRAANVILESVPAPGGGWMIDLKGTLLEYYVLEVGPLGERRVSCVRDPRNLPAHAPLPRRVVAVAEER